MKNNFEVYGLFYKNKGHLCRKYLDIRKNDSKDIKPDLMVVMMNPGSSSPKDGNDNNTIESIAIPDRTQDQIMKVMTSCNFNYARILNLSDLREAKSKIFYSKLKDLQNVPHSIFSAERIKDFETLFVKDVPVIFVWGVNKKLKSLAMKAITLINTKKPFGLLKKGTNSAYYHPLPQNYYDQEKWCEDIITMLNKQNI